MNRHKKNAEKISLSRSQPDLSCSGVNKINSDIDFRRGVSAPRPRTKGREDIESSGELWPSAEMVEILIKENSALKLEVETCYQRISRTQKVIIIYKKNVECKSDCCDAMKVRFTPNHMKFSSSTALIKCNFS